MPLVLAVFHLRHHAAAAAAISGLSVTGRLSPFMQGQVPAYHARGKYNKHCGCTAGEDMFIGVSLTNEAPSARVQGLYNGISGDANSASFATTMFMVAMERQGDGTGYAPGYTYINGASGFSKTIDGTAHQQYLNVLYNSVKTLNRVATEGQQKCGSSGRVWSR